MNQKEYLYDQLLVVQTLTKLLNASDRKDYALMTEQLADEIIIDFGGVKKSQVIKAFDLVSWSKTAYRDLVTMHMTFNHEVIITGEKATSFCYGRALHKYKEEKQNSGFWNIYAQYEHELIKAGGQWKIAKIRMTPKWQEGNPDIIAEAYQAVLNEK